jgi:folate-binding Fe-S cluster repair protein YgfZ
MNYTYEDIIKTMQKGKKILSGDYSLSKDPKRMIEVMRVWDYYSNNKEVFNEPQKWVMEKMIGDLSRYITEADINIESIEVMTA